MKIRFDGNTETHKIDDIINSEEEYIELDGYPCKNGAVIKNWNFINYKRPSDKVSSSSMSKWVYFVHITFIDCVFKDVNFIGGITLDDCVFKNCTFENCLLTDHIRWCYFQRCTFKSCILAGTFQRSPFSKSCKFNKVSVDCCGDVYSILINNQCTEDERIELLRYFYPVESKVFDIYKVGDPYFVRKFDDDFINDYMSECEICKINGNDYYKDVIKEIEFSLSNYAPDVRIAGKYHPLVNFCKSYSAYNQK